MWGTSTFAFLKTYQLSPPFVKLRRSGYGTWNIKLVE
jgi:hypothetical protein